MVASNSSPLIVFVHVPKAAGSTVNRALQDRFDDGYPHCEEIIDRPNELTRRAPRIDWISGHVELDRLQRNLRAATPRRLRLFAAIREPVQQVMSHYNWIIEIFHRGEIFYRRHPAQIKAISARLRASDHADPTVVIDNLKAYPGLFFNQQSRTILGSDFDWNGGGLLKRLGRYEYVANEDSLSDLVALMTGAVPAQASRENASSYHFDKSVFATPKLRKFLMRENFLDWTLYQALKSPRVRRAISPTYRPAIKAVEVP